MSVDNLRHAEYYGMQSQFDELYAKSKNGEIFTNLMDLILSNENILLAYRNIKTNSGSNTPGTDNVTIEDIGRMNPQDVIDKVKFILTGSAHGYRPKPVRRKEIPKPDGSKRPLGIPCMWDRLVQQCIKQIMEPICEAKFSHNSYGFRPNRSVEHAIQRAYFLMQRSKLQFVIEFDIEGFFDNVNHSKLIKQIWAMGIRDKYLIYIIKQILKAPIKMPEGNIMYPTKGTPQGGIISPLLANIVLNELDHWVESQWTENPVIDNYQEIIRDGGCKDKSHGYRAMRKTNLKEMYIVRYADDFRIFCRSYNEAERILYAVEDWMDKRLKLKLSKKKTKIVNLRKKYSDFLGFKMRLRKKGDKYVVQSHMSDKALKTATNKLIEQAKNVAKPRGHRTEKMEIELYNSIVSGIQNYYSIATEINKDASVMHWATLKVLTNRLSDESGCRLVDKGRALTETEREKYGRSKMLRYVAGSQEPIYPIGFTQTRKPLTNKYNACAYTEEGRKELHHEISVNKKLMWKLINQTTSNESAEYADNRLSLFSAQKGKCAVTGIEFQTMDDIHCHHKVPKAKGGTDEYHNLTLVLNQVHILIHAKTQETINEYLKIIKLNYEQKVKLNALRRLVGNKPI